MPTLSREEVNAIMAKARQLPDDYITEHMAYLRSALKDFETYKSDSKRDQVWRIVETETAKLEKWLKNLK